jgi:hypothetical protein
LITCDEKFGSRKTNADAQGTTLESLWTLGGSNDEIAIRQKLADTAPPIYYDAVEQRTLYRHDYNVEQVGFELWDGVVNYAQQDASGDSFSFDTTGGTAHITQSFGTRSYGSSPPDFKGAIGVSKDSVDGVDIAIPSLKFSETHPIPANLVTTAYVNTLASLTGTVNGGPWRNYPAYSVLFLGATGQSQTDGTVPITFSFDVGQNATLSIAGLSVDKYAWEYLWAYYEDTEDTGAKKVLKKPKWIFVETVYQPGNFSALGI